MTPDVERSSTQHTSNKQQSMQPPLCGRHLQPRTHIVRDWDKPGDRMPGSFQRKPKAKWKVEGMTPTTPDVEPSWSQHNGSQQQSMQPPAYDNTHTCNDKDDTNDDAGSDNHNSLPWLRPDRTTTGGNDNPNHSFDSSSSDGKSLASSTNHTIEDPEFSNEHTEPKSHSKSNGKQFQGI